MKKLISLLMLLVLVTSLVLAQNEDTGANSPQLLRENQTPGGEGNDDLDPELEEDEVEDEDTDEPLLISPGPNNAKIAQTKEELKVMLQERKQEMVQEIAQMPKGEQNVYRNQNTVREAVHAMLAMEGLVGGIGKNISAIARDFNNSVKSTIMAEEKIQEKKGLARFFSGGDEEAAEEIEQEVERNRLKVQELKQLMAECDCDEEVKAMLQEQIQNMEQEQERLGELAEKEKKSKGMFGWLWK